jgi:ribonuclease Z
MMRPLLHPFLLNGRFGDPALYIETLFEKHAILFDIGDITALPPRKLHRIGHVFVSHAHIDHFVGFDHLLRVLVGCDKTIRLYGPVGFIERVEHKLLAYHWNLVDRYRCDLVFVVSEVSERTVCTSRFRLKNAFRGEHVGQIPMRERVIVTEPTFRVSIAFLAHRTPCLGFAIQETAHVNVWKTRLEAMGLSVGPWLRELKHAVIENQPDDHVIHVGIHSVGSRCDLPLGALRNVVTTTPGQKIAYVTDVADTDDNRTAIVDLARDADLLFIEAAFAAQDSALAAERAHLTTSAAGEIARAANVRRVEPFHFSPRYEGEQDRMLREVTAAFHGT